MIASTDTPTVPAMDAGEHRTEHVRTLVAGAGGPTGFANRYGAGRWTQVQVSQWISPTSPKGIGRKLARDIESAVGLPIGSLDLPLNPATQSQSPSLRPDPTMLAESIAALRMMAKRRGWDYDPEVHADATCDAYELRAMLPALPTTADVIDFGQKVAERLAREFGNGEGGPGAGASVGGNDRSGDAARARKAGATGRSR